MRYLIFSLAGCLAIATAANDQTPTATPPKAWADLVVPAEVKGTLYEFQVVTATKAGKRVLWIPIDDIEGKVSVLPPAIAADPNALMVIVRQPGRYRWIAISAAGDEPAWAQTTLVVEAPRPPPPPDTLRPALKRAYDADPMAMAAKRAFAVSLAGFYEAAADFSQAAALTTTEDLLGKLRTERSKFVPDSSLVDVRKVLAAEQVAVFGLEPLKLDAAVRAKAKDLFSRFADALMEVSR